ncbi:hypothetical protein [Sphingobium sp.]|uniref:hypothetical protein n=1 Tax=Sphingobium sp. TaxID=1912891 RepID=UPI002C01B9C2|nr:hypothetical protein [Sphingobium sp.]HUD92462.1 hypothetical protein [Sphingobium sp.]
MGGAGTSVPPVLVDPPLELLEDELDEELLLDEEDELPVLPKLDEPPEEELPDEEDDELLLEEPVLPPVELE